MNEVNHKSGFINIVGNPNVGKSTLMNALMGEKMSIITAKPQTTRHRILGIISGDDFQVILSDTPGTIKDPHYKMQTAMNKFAYSVFHDGDLILFLTDIFEEYQGDEFLFEKLRRTEIPIYLIMNKIDLVKNDQVLDEKIKWWTSRLDFKNVFAISALKNEGVSALLHSIIQFLPEGPEYYPKDQLSDKPQRFFISEIIREKIFLNYHQEIPYSCEVVIDRYEETEKNGEDFTKIYATIFATRKSHKHILIGRKGEAIKKLGIDSRIDIETYLGNRIYLELYVKIKEQWRDDDRFLKSFGYR